MLYYDVHIIYTVYTVYSIHRRVQDFIIIIAIKSTGPKVINNNNIIIQ